MTSVHPQPVEARESLAQLACRRCQPSEAIAQKLWIADQHYLQSAPPGFVHVYEYTLRGQLVGGCILGRTAARQYNADRVLEVTRFFFVDGTPPNVESRGLALMRKHVRTWLPAIRLLLAYSDPEQGHEGTIYAADGWCDLGLTDGPRGYGWQSRQGRRDRKASRKLRWVRTP